MAQVADILGGRTAPMSALQQSVAARTLPLEVHPDVKHDKRGILSMARNDGATLCSGALVLSSLAPGTWPARQRCAVLIVIGMRQAVLSAGCADALACSALG